MLILGHCIAFMQVGGVMGKLIMGYVSNFAMKCHVSCRDIVTRLFYIRKLGSVYVFIILEFVLVHS